MLDGCALALAVPAALSLSLTITTTLPLALTAALSLFLAIPLPIALTPTLALTLQLAAVPRQQTKVAGSSHRVVKANNHGAKKDDYQESKQNILNHFRNLFRS
jgi:hypothetical protein